MTAGSNTVLIVADRYPDPDLNTAFLRESRIRLLNGLDADHETLQLVRDERPDLVIEDLAPGRGADSSFCAALKAEAATRDTPIILVTDPLRIDQARATGADALLCKPLVPHAFYDAVRQYVNLPTRSQARYPVNLRFTFEWSGRRVQAFSRDISLTGVFLKTDRGLETGTHLELEFALPGDPRTICCGGYVRREQQDDARPRHQGVGIEFEGIHDGDLRRLERYVRSFRYRLGWFR